MITTIAEFKERLQVGTQVKQVWNSIDGNVVPHHIVTITEVVTNGAYGTSPGLSYISWFSFLLPFEFTDRGWFRTDYTDGFRLSEYQWVDVPPEVPAALGVPK